MAASERLERIIGHFNSTDIKKQCHSSNKIFQLTIDEFAEGVLTTEERIFYEENGFLLKKTFYAKEELDGYLERFYKLCRKEVKVSPKMVFMRDISKKGVDKTKVENVTKLQLFQEDPVLKNFSENPKTLRFVKAFTGPSCSSCNSMLIQKPPDPGTRSSRHPVHQDLWFFPFRPAHKIVACWTAMQHINEENGCLYVVPGSHRQPLHRHGYPKDGPVNKAYHQIIDYDITKEPFALPVIMEPGDTIFFHPLLYHGSGPNLSQTTRKAIATHYVSEDCHWIPIPQGHLQSLIRDELEHMSLIAYKQKQTFQEIWLGQSKVVQGSRHGWTQMKYGEETEELDMRN